MTREEMEKEAREAALSECAVDESAGWNFRLGYLAAAEPRERALEAMKEACQKWEWSSAESAAVVLACEGKIAKQTDEIAALRARVAELEGMVPRWVPVAQKISLDIQGWLPLDDQRCGDSERLWLMVPPIPLPEPKP